MNEVLLGLLLFLVPLAVALVPFAQLVRMPRKPKAWKKIALVLVNALFCLLATLFFARWPGYFSANADSYAMAGERYTEAGTTGLPPIIRIDNSGNRILVDDLDSNEEDSLVEVLTDRGKLARFLQQLEPHQALFAQVVCDIGFTSRTEQDSALWAAIRGLAAHRKILLARTRHGNTPLLEFGEDVMARVTEHQQNGLIAWHTLRIDGDPSLPYVLHLRTNERVATPIVGDYLWETGAGGNALVFPGFMPAWNHLPEPPRQVIGATQEAVVDDGPIPLGQALHVGWPRLLRRLEAAEGAIIFIGEFPSHTGEGTTDQHRTFRGTASGADLLIDLFLEMEQGAQRVRGSTLGLLLLVFAVVSWRIFHRAWSVRRPNGPPQHYWGMVRSFVRGSVLALWPFLFIMITSWLLLRFTHQQWNLAPIALYLTALNGLVDELNEVRAEQVEQD